MSLTDLRKTMGRQPFTIVELYLDTCTRTFGVSPCNATGEPCYNTRKTCKFLSAYDIAPKVYRFCSPCARLPMGLQAIPCVTNISLTPATIDPGKTLGLRADASITLQDFPHSDIGADPYVHARTYDPLTKGTYFGKLRARNPFYTRRKMVVYSGYLAADGSYDPANFEPHTYFIDSWVGPDASGRVMITGKDILALADDSVAQVPAVSVGTVLANFSDTDTSFTLAPAGVGDGMPYPTSGYIRIGSEVMHFTRSHDVMMITRGDYNTAKASHNASDAVQLCYVVTSQKPQDIVYDLMVNYAKVPAGYLDKAGWDAEQLSYLPRLYSTIITSPTGVSKLLVEMSEQMSFSLWWDETAALVRMKALRPAATGESKTIGNLYHVLADSITVTDVPKDQVSEVWVFAGQIDPTQQLDLESNYRLTQIDVDVDAESVAEYNQTSVKKIYSRWITIENAVAALDLAQKYLARYRDIPRQVSVAVDAKDADIKLADFITYQTNLVQTETGDDATLNLQVIKRNEAIGGTTFTLTAQECDFETPVSERLIIIATHTTNVNIRSLHDMIYSAPTAGTTVRVVVNAGVVVGSTSTALPAMIPGSWPAGVTINLDNNGWIVGQGGKGGFGGSAPFDFSHPNFPGSDASCGGETGGAGAIGGPAIDFTAHTVNINNTGTIGAGGNGGGGAGGGTSQAHYFGGYTYEGSGGGTGGAGAGYPAGHGGDRTNTNNYVIGGRYPGAIGLGGRFGIKDPATGALVWLSYGANPAPADFVLAIEGGTGGLGNASSDESPYTGLINSTRFQANGGKGGTLGTTGNAGHAAGPAYYFAGSGTPTNYQAPGGVSPAIVGDAVRGNANITWTATGTRLGNIT